MVSGLVRVRALVFSAHTGYCDHQSYSKTDFIDIHDGLRYDNKVHFMPLHFAADDSLGEWHYRQTTALVDKQSMRDLTVNLAYPLAQASGTLQITVSASASASAPVRTTASRLPAVHALWKRAP